MGEEYNQEASKISIVVPVYNVQPYLEKCLDFLIRQSQPNIEIIVVNDGSTDNSLDIIHRYALKDQRIRVIDKANEGLGAARNAGLKISTGKYVMFVDADDWISNEACNKLLSIAENSNADVVIFDLTFYDNKRYITREQYQTQTAISGEEYLLSAMRNGGFSPTVCNKFVRREIIENIFFPEDTKHEDIYFTILSLLECKRVVTTNDVSYYYRINRLGSLTNMLNFEDFQDILNIYKIIFSKLEDKDMNYIYKNQFFLLNIVERINMEVLLKLINGTRVVDRDMTVFNLRSNPWFKSLAKYYIRHGRLSKHRIMLIAFFISPRLFESLGHLYYAAQKARKK
jgi:glycosyltransferase involved in cell wall biosynthesis